MTIYNPFDVVEVPFPFTDLPVSKRRKALIISNHGFSKSSNCSVLMMITSAIHRKWLNDVPIHDLDAAGLKKACVARMKLFTLDNGLIISKAGELSIGDRENVLDALKKTLAGMI